MRHNVEEMALIPSSGGVFEIYANGQKIFSKFDTDQFPDHKEVINQLESMINYG
ncbi:Rdx family protein [Salipaludibacillus sp. CUR1]|nr:Rdx family protein [Salipaludibacillus sp. CUR1]